VVEDIDPGVLESEHEDSDLENEKPDSKEQSMVFNAPSMSFQGLRALNDMGNHDTQMRVQFPASSSSLPHSLTHSLTGYSILIVVHVSNLSKSRTVKCELLYTLAGVASDRQSSSDTNDNKVVKKVSYLHLFE
jgi:hypothetical protein